MHLLAPMPTARRPARIALLLGGLTLYGISDGLLVLAGLGLDPRDVLHQGLSRTLGLQVGTWAVLVGALVLLGWIPLRQRPGVGTACTSSSSACSSTRPSRWCPLRTVWGGRQRCSSPPSS